MLSDQMAELSGMRGDSDLLPDGIPEQIRQMIRDQLAANPHVHDVRRALAGVEGAVVVEVGAFMGGETAIYAQLAAKVVALEPGPVKARSIREMIDVLRAVGAVTGNVTIVEAAAGDVDGTVALFLPNSLSSLARESQQDSLHDQSFWSNTSRDEHSGERLDQRAVDVPVVRLDSILAEPIDLLEIDAQGHDAAVLRGAERLITVHGVAVIRVEFAPTLLRRAGEDPLKMLHWLADRGYVCFDTPVLADTRERVLEPWLLHSALKRQSSDSSIAPGPLLFQDYVAALESQPWLLSGANVGFWRDLLCFQS